MNTIEQAREVSRELRSSGKWFYADAMDALIAELAALKGQEPVDCGYDKTTGSCTRNPCCHPIADAQPTQHDSIPEAIRDDLERADWTPKEALEFYAAGRHYDTPGGRTRILDTGAIASNALKSLDISYAFKKGDVALSECSDGEIYSRMSQLLAARMNTPEGYQLVPVEPTFEMMLQMPASANATEWTQYYKAMLAAAKDQS